MTKEHYKTLGVEETASLDEIKKAYRRLAVLTHPDKGGSKEEFSKISEAHEILSDPQKRQQYDSGIPMNLPFDFNPMDMFQTMFRQTNPTSQNSHHQISITLRDAYFGIKKSIKVTITKFCFPCQNKCATCDGKGTIMTQRNLGPIVLMTPMLCEKCCGSGQQPNYVKTDCSLCNGNGSYRDEQICILDIPLGVHSGYQIISKGLGEQSKTANGESGDLCFSIMVAHDPNFSREDNDLIHKITIPFKKTMTGMDLVIPHFDGDIKINSLMFGIINPCLRYALPQKGFNGGSLVIMFIVDYSNMPILTETQINLLNEIFQ